MLLENKILEFFFLINVSDGISMSGFVYSEIA